MPPKHTKNEFPDRQAGKTAIAIVYWGRLGAGAALMNQLCEAMARDERFEIYASPSLQSELPPALPACRLISLSTFSSLSSLMLGTLTLPFTVRRIVRRMAAAEIRVVVTVMPHVWGAALRAAASRAGLRTILMIHDAEPHPGERRRLLDLLVRSEARASDRVVTLSNHVADQLLARGAPPGKLIRLFHPVFRFGAGAPPASRAAGPFRLLFFGRILPYKGVPMLLEAFASLRRAGAKCVLRVVGRGRDTAPAELEHQDGLTLDEGWVAPDAIAGVIESADAIVLPYLEASQSGVVAASYGAGLPVVVTPVGGLVEQVIDGETGVIAREATAAALTEAIRRLMDDPELYASCRAGVQRFADEHSFDRFARALGDSILDVLAGGRDDRTRVKVSS